MRRVVVLKPSEFSDTRVCAFGAAFAGLAVAMIVLLVVSYSEWLAGLVLLAFGLIWPAEVARRMAATLRYPRHAAVIGAWFAIGLSAPVWLVSILRLSGSDLWGRLLATAGFAGLYAAAAVGIWWFVRRAWVEVIEQDGTRCPGCGYCLVGNTTQTCSECGRPFTLPELGATSASALVVPVPDDR